MHSTLVLVMTSVALGGLLRAQTASVPCYEPNLGALLGSADDTVFPAITFTTPFPAFGSAFLQAEVSSNGFLWLGALSNPDSGCCSGTGAALASGQARICALWSDLVTDGIDGSGVYHNSLPGREVITWFKAFESYDPNIRFTVQLQLAGTGEFTVWFHPSTTIAQIPHTAVCGVSPGGVPDPGSTDFSAVIPYNSNTQATLYEQWSTTGFDLAQRTFEFLPNGNGGWLLNDRPLCPFVSGTWALYGAGCPLQTGISGASFYETFTGASLDLDNLEFELTPIGTVGYQVQATSNSFFTGYVNVVPLGDDQSIDQVLPFPFPNPGGVCTTAGFCSNGFVWMDNFNNGAPAAPYVPAFLFEGPRIAAMWTDIDLTAGGTAYYDATPTVAYFTWFDAPDYYNPSLRSTFQIQLFSDGRIKLCYQGLNLGATRPALAGYGLGGALHDPGSVDITASVPFTSGTGLLPVTLDWRGTPPVLGQLFPMETGNLRPSAVAGLLVVGVTKFDPGVPLAALGMQDCFARASLDLLLGFVATPPTTQLNLLTIPGQAAFVGFQLHAQVAILDPGITQFGLATSNGGTMTLGFF
ncbi:MAG TPA: hypothetical protein VFD82_19505 [Planctomycetota bacterium]|nr:hypothetical protein [Planctomycetota bacterium]